MNILPLANLDCQACGACCTSPISGGTYVELLEGDAERLGVELDRLAAQTGYGTWALKTKEIAQNGWGFLACTALTGEIGADCSCSIYGTRPSACQEFRPGSVECHESREEAGLERRPVA